MDEIDQHDAPERVEANDLPTASGRPSVKLGSGRQGRYRPSRFNAHTTAPDGTLVLYNTFSRHICAIPGPGATRVRSYLSRRGYEGSLDPVGQYLLEAGYILEAGVDEAMRFDVAYANQHYPPASLIVCLLSCEDCNFRCVYCSQPFKYGIMSPEVRQTVRRMFELRIPRLKALSVAWFGGEPLLGYEAIEELAPVIQELTKKHDVLYRGSISTNGYLLTPDRSRAMLGWGIRSYQVTIDGLGAEHDRKRPLRDGGPTFQRIVENLAAMRGLDEKFDVRLRVNVDEENFGELEAYFSFLKVRFGRDPRFRVAFQPVARWGGPNDSKLRIIAGKEVLARQRTLRQLARRAGVPIESSIQLAKSGFLLCHASMAGGLTIGADGRVLKCTNHSVIPEEMNRIGSILQDGTLSLDVDKHSRWYSPYYLYDKDCRRCFYLPVCRGGLLCPAVRVQGRRPQCPQEKTHIRSVLLEYWDERRTSDGGEKLRIPLASGDPLEAEPERPTGASPTTAVIA